MRVLSLFDGISCGMVALERAGIPVEEYVAYEIDENAIKVSKSNYPQIKHCGDVTNANFSLYRGFDILIGGSPCQDLSISGKRKGLKGSRSGLFYEYVRALNDVKPKYFLFENNFKMPKEAEDEITKQLGVKPVYINSADFSCQWRERLYWTNMPILDWNISDVTVRDIIDYCESEKDLSMLVVYSGKKEVDVRKRNRIGVIGKGGQGERVYSINGKSVTISANGGGRGAKTGLYRFGDKVRKLTPLEAERCQTLPDNYTNCISSSQRYKCIGNGWTVDVIAHIFKGLKESNENV